MKLTAKQWLIVAGVAIALYVLWRAKETVKEAVEGAKKKIDEAADGIAAPIANAYLAVTLPKPVSVNARLRLPSGLMIDADEIQLNSDMTYSYQKKRYKVTGRNPSDNVYETMQV